MNYVDIRSVLDTSTTITDSRAQQNNDETIYYMIGTRFFVESDPRDFSLGAAHAYNAKCELLMRVTVPSVLLAAKTMYAKGGYENVKLRWQFDSSLMVHDSTCKAALEIANATLNGVVHLGSFRANSVLDVARDSIMILSRLDSDDAIHKNGLMNIVDATVDGVKETGYWYVSLPNAVYWLTDQGGPCGSFVSCACLHKGLMQSHAIYGPKIDTCNGEKNYTRCILNNRLGLYAFAHNNLDEHTVNDVSQHFPLCKNFDKCRSYLCRDGTSMDIDGNGNIKGKINHVCEDSAYPMALYTQTGLQDSAKNDKTGLYDSDQLELSGTAVCSILTEYGVEFPLAHVEEPVMPECLRFHDRAPECMKKGWIEKKGASRKRKTRRIRDT
eukprot:CFRG6210T1